MIEVVSSGNAGLMTGLLDRMGQGGAARARLYNGARISSSAEATSPLIAMILFDEPAGTIDVNGDLLLTTGTRSTLLVGAAPTWARVFNGNEEHLFDCDARVATAINTGQELVLTAPAGLYVGGLVQIVSGTFSARP